MLFGRVFAPNNKALQAQNCVPGRLPVSMNPQVRCIVGHRRTPAFGRVPRHPRANGSSCDWEQDSDLVPRRGRSGWRQRACRQSSSGCRDHRASRSMWTRRGPMLLATAWSLKTGKRQCSKLTKPWPVNGHALDLLHTEVEPFGRTVRAGLANIGSGFSTVSFWSRARSSLRSRERSTPRHRAPGHRRTRHVPGPTS